MPIASTAGRATRDPRYIGTGRGVGIAGLDQPQADLRVIAAPLLNRLAERLQDAL